MISLTTATPAVGAAFLASLVEVVEAFTIVLAAGMLRGWRGAIAGTTAGLAALALIVVTLDRFSTGSRFIRFSSSSAYCSCCSAWAGCARSFYARLERDRYTMHRAAFIDRPVEETTFAHSRST